MSARELHLRLDGGDPERLRAAGRDLDHLLQFPYWDPPSDPPFLQRLGEDLFHLAFRCPALIEALLAGLNRSEGHLRLWLEAPNPRLARLPWEYLYLPGEVLAMAGHGAAELGWPAPRAGNPAHAFLSLHPRLSLVRGTGPRQARAPVERIGALQLLIVWADPDCDHWGVNEPQDAPGTIGLTLVPLSWIQRTEFRLRERMKCSNAGRDMSSRRKPMYPAG